MKTCTRCGDSKPLDKFRPQRRYCRSCGSAEHREWYLKNKEAAISASIRWNRSHQKELNVRARAWREVNADRLLAKSRANREHINAKQRAWCAANKERSASYFKKWSKKNKDVIAAHAAARRARRLMATPSWANKSELAQAYTEASFVQWATGKPHHVDHIYPLVHAKFSGLRVPWNLQILTASENMSKGNRIPTKSL